MSTNGLTQGTIYPIYSTSLTIGRTTGQDMPDIEIVDTDLDRSVSRLHARVFLENNTFYLQDLGSSFSTYKKNSNGYEILQMRENTTLTEGDTFRLGSVNLKFHSLLPNLYG